MAKLITLTVSFFMLIAICYAFLLLFGFNHYLNFFPSFEWALIALIFSIPPSLFTLFNSARRTPPAINASKSKKIFGKVFTFLIFNYLFYSMFAYGVGPLFTSLSSEVIEKDIVGTKKYIFYVRAPSDYYIESPDLPQGLFAKVYISREEYKNIPVQVRLHITCKQSFFGTTIERYSFVN